MDNGQLSPALVVSRISQAVDSFRFELRTLEHFKSPRGAPGLLAFRGKDSFLPPCQSGSEDPARAKDWFKQ
jgi:hypothetical protein